MSNEVVKITQSSVINYGGLFDVIADVDRRMAIYNIKNLVITEDNIKEIKKFRTQLTKEFSEYEKDRIRIKDEVLAPYAEFDKIYKDQLAKKFKDADAQLKEAVDEIENGLREEIRTEILAYFNELVTSYGIDFVTFEQTGIKILLSDSKKSLRERVLKFVDEIKSGLDLIDTLENKDRILTRFKTNLSASKSIMEVNREVELENQERIRREQAIAPKPEPIVPTPVVASKIEVEVVKPPVKIVQEELITLVLKVTGTKTQLIAVRDFLKKEGINYE